MKCISLVVLLFFASSCAVTEVTINGTTRQNDGGSAADIYIYQLAGEDAFQNVQLNTFWLKGEEELATDLLKKEPLVKILPDETRVIRVKNIKGAKYLGIAADLRQPDARNWKDTIKLKRWGKKKAIVTIGATRIEVVD